MQSANWTREETIIAFNVYCKIPFKRSSKSNPTIVKYAKLLGRTPSALNMKIGNFGRLDPELKKQGITGLVNGSKLEEVIWNEFNGNWEKLAFESEVLLEKLQEEEINITTFPEGKEKLTVTKARINQQFFRNTVLSSYNSKCCITGLSISSLLEACHIKSWSEDLNNRTNPHNGLCLNILHHKAFDEGFITVTADHKIIVSNQLEKYTTDNSVVDLFLKYDNKSIIKPDRFLPAKEFLDYHYQTKFLR